VQNFLLGKVLVPAESLRLLVFGAAMVVMMLVRPAGLWPSAVRRRELTASDDADEAAADEASEVAGGEKGLRA
jgi:branched-chain amino acid transport system permease protein